MSNLNIRISFIVSDRSGLSFKEFLDSFPLVKLTEKQISRVEAFLTTFCLVVLQESDSLSNDRKHLTTYLQSLIHVNDNGEWYLIPIYGLKLYFFGLRVISIYNVTYRQ